MHWQHTGLVLLATIAMITMLMFMYRRQHSNWRGCRVEYTDTGGTSFGYVSQAIDDNVIVQDPWRKASTIPIPKKHMRFVRAEDVSKTSRWAAENEPSTREMLEFYNVSPKTCA